jgi:Disulphide bond corrector protein DsbC
VGPLTRRPLRLAIGAIFAAGVVTAVVLLQADRARAGAIQLDFPVNRAHLSVSARATGPDDAEVEVTFSPTVPGGHFYGTTMPRTGIDGAGRPTLLELAEGEWLVSGPVVASVAAHDQSLPGFNTSFPLYPDGPVTLRLPIRRTTPGAATPARLALTFMVCTSSGVCFPPVERSVVELPVAP